MQAYVDAEAHVWHHTDRAHDSEVIRTTRLWLRRVVQVHRCVSKHRGTIFTLKIHSHYPRV